MSARRCGDGRAGLLVLALLAGAVPVTAAPQEASPPPTGEGSGTAWEGRASLAGYFLTNASDYLVAVAAADRGPLHLEARYGYEDRETASLFAGWNLALGGTVEATVVPMLGAVLGRTNGLVPALELTLSWGPLQYYLETEVVIDLGNGADSYFYAWSELSIAPVEWARAGLALQRTRVIQTSRELTPGLLLGFSARRVDVTGYWFAPGAEGQYAVLSAGVRF